MASLKSLVLAAVHLGFASAFWRMECQGRAGLARIDPLITPGSPSQHLHSIHGSSGFGMSATYDDLRNADCTSCRVKQDKSAYWHPSLMFQDANTKEFELVPQVGGMLAYYFLFAENITAFPPGFRMIAGDSRRRQYTAGDPWKHPEKSAWEGLGDTKQEILKQRAVGFNCLNYARGKNEDTLDRHILPGKDFLDQNCADGIRFELMFPSCWNGRDLDGPTHTEHVAYPKLVMDNDCPADFPVRLPGLLFETIWATNAFKGRQGRFVIANGDTEGFGYHGDFMSGWDRNVLQQAADICRSQTGAIEACPIFDIQDENAARQCQIKLPEVLAKEEVNKPGLMLPGNVAIVYKDGTREGGADLPAVPVLPLVPAPAKPEVKVEPAAPAPAAPAPAAPAPAAPAPAVPSQAAPEPAAPAAAKPETTPPAVAPVGGNGEEGKIFVSTQYVTVGNVVSKILWVEEVAYVTQFDDITTTVTATAIATAAPAKRDASPASPGNPAHQRRHAQDEQAEHLHRHVHRHHGHQS